MSNFISQNFQFTFSDFSVVCIFLTTTTLFIAPSMFLIQCCSTMIHLLDNTAVSPPGVTLVIYRVFYLA